MCFHYQRSQGFLIQALAVNFSPIYISPTHYPLELKKNNRKECGVVYLDKLQPESTFVTLGMDIFDPDFRDEGRFCLGNNCQGLFGGDASSQLDRKVKSLSYDLPASWWSEGENEICFFYEKTAGFKVLSLEISGQKDTPVPPPSEKVCRVLDFDVDSRSRSIRAGQFLEHAYSDYGVRLEVKDRNGRGKGHGIAFDSSNPTGGDSDLRTSSQKNLLIRAESTKDKDRDGYVDRPDDHRSGATFIFGFDEPVSLEFLTFIDIDKRGDAYLRLYDENGLQIGSSFGPSRFSENSLEKIGVHTEGVKRAEIWLRGSGAIDDLEFCR